MRNCILLTLSLKLPFELLNAIWYDQDKKTRRIQKITVAHR